MILSDQNVEGGGEVVEESNSWAMRRKEKPETRDRKVINIRRQQAQSAFPLRLSSHPLDSLPQHVYDPNIFL